MSIGDMSDDEARQWAKNIAEHRAEEWKRQEADRKDANRYRWLRDENSALERLHDAALLLPHGDDLDAAIDSAMAQTHNDQLERGRAQDSEETKGGVSASARSVC